MVVCRKDKIKKLGYRIECIIYFKFNRFFSFVGWEVEGGGGIS